MTDAHCIATLVVFPMTTALVLLGLDRYPNLREACTVVCAFVMVVLATSLLGTASEAGIEYRALTLVPGVDLALRADSLGLVFALLASVLWLATSFYSIGYMRVLSEHAQTRYFASFAAAIGATMGVALSANLLTLYLFYELLTLATYPLVAHKESEVALAASRKYLAYTLSAGVLLLAAMVLLYLECGTLDFAAGGIAALQRTDGWRQVAIFAGLIGGFGVKSALIPVHGWLPSAMVAPTPVSALLHAVAVVKSGVFGCLRVVGFVFGASALRALGAVDWVIALAAVTVLFASIVALSQDNLKRRLAYSTIGHLSYIVLGAALLSANAVMGAVLHMVNHAFLKITLFFCAGAIYATTGRDRVSQLAGIGRRMPVTMLAFAVAAVGLAGVPPLNGFVGKWYLCLGALESGRGWVAVVLIVSGVLNIAYLFPVVYTAFFEESRNGNESESTGGATSISAASGFAGEAPLPMLLPLVLTALISLLLGLWPDSGPAVWSKALRIGESIQ